MSTDEDCAKARVRHVQFSRALLGGARQPVRRRGRGSENIAGAALQNRMLPALNHTEVILLGRSGCEGSDLRQGYQDLRGHRQGS